MKALTFYSALSVFFFGKTKQIKEADKGEAVVIMDRDYYETKIIEMLLNPEFYSKISENQDKKKPQCKILKDYCLKAFVSSRRKGSRFCVKL